MWCVHRPNAGEILGRLTVTCSQFCMRYTSAWSTMTSSKEDRKSKSRALSLVREKVQILASYPVDVFIPNFMEVGMGIGTGDKANTNTTVIHACWCRLGMWVWHVGLAGVEHALYDAITTPSSYQCGVCHAMDSGVSYPPPWTINPGTSAPPIQYHSLLTLCLLTAFQLLSYLDSLPALQPFPSSDSVSPLTESCTRPPHLSYLFPQ